MFRLARRRAPWRPLLATLLIAGSTLALTTTATQASTQVKHLSLERARESCFKMATRPAERYGSQVTVTIDPAASAEDCGVHLLFRPHPVKDAPSPWRAGEALRPLFAQSGYVEVRGESGRIRTFPMAALPDGLAAYWTTDGALMVIVGQDYLFDGSGHPASVKVYALGRDGAREWLFHGGRIQVRGQESAAAIQRQLEWDARERQFGFLNGDRPMIR